MPTPCRADARRLHRGRDAVGEQATALVHDVAVVRGRRSGGDDLVLDCGAVRRGALEPERRVEAQFERRARPDLYRSRLVYTARVAKHLIDIDEDALRAARAELGTQTIKETVNRALRQAGGGDSARVKRSLDRLARAQLADREDAWR